VNRLIKYTGYGNAAGLLASRGLMGNVQPQSNGDYSSDDEDSETEEYAMDKSQIDPMIGEENLSYIKFWSAANKKAISILRLNRSLYNEDYY